MFIHATYYCPKCKFATTRAKCSYCGGPVSYEKPSDEEIEIAQYKQLLDNDMLRCMRKEKFEQLQAKYGDL
jgi:hypothetical protein